MALTITTTGFEDAYLEPTPPGPEIVAWATGTVAQIKSMLDANKADTINIEDYWSLGQQRTVGNIIWVLTDFNSTTSGGTEYDAIIHSYNTIENHVMNDTNTNVGGWQDSKMRNTEMTKLYNNLDSDFKTLIIQASIISGSGNATDSIQTTNDYLWAMSEREVQGAKTYSGSQEYNKCKQFAYFALSTENKKKTGSDASWWLRSPDVSYSSYFCRVYYGGGAGSGNAGTAYGVVPAAAI